MLLEILIVLEVVAFSFLALGIVPFRGTNDEAKLPYLNKVLFVLVAMIMFWALAVVSNGYEYNYCYINESTADYSLNTSTQTATCDAYTVTNEGLAYVNYGMGFISLVVGIILMLLTLSTGREVRNREDDDAGY